MFILSNQMKALFNSLPETPQKNNKQVLFKSSFPFSKNRKSGNREKIKTFLLKNLREVKKGKEREKPLSWGWLCLIQFDVPSFLCFLK